MYNTIYKITKKYIEYNEMKMKERGKIDIV